MEITGNSNSNIKINCKIHDYAPPIGNGLIAEQINMELLIITCCLHTHQILMCKFPYATVGSSCVMILLLLIEIYESSYSS